MGDRLFYAGMGTHDLGTEPWVLSGLNILLAECPWKSHLSPVCLIF